jgi:hypothetical protein
MDFPHRVVGGVMAKSVTRLWRFIVSESTFQTAAAVENAKNHDLVALNGEMRW